MQDPLYAGHPDSPIIHVCTPDAAICEHSPRSGRLLKVTRPPRPGPMGARVKDPIAFLARAEAMQREIESQEAHRAPFCIPSFGLGVFLTCGVLACIVCAWYLLRA